MTHVVPLTVHLVWRSIVFTTALLLATTQLVDAATTYNDIIYGAEYGVDAIRKVFLGSLPALGVELFGHVMSVSEELLFAALLGGVLLGAAVAAFSRQE